MIEILESNPDVIAVKVGGKLGRPDIESITDLVEKSLAARDKTHIFVEVSGLSGVELDAIANNAPRMIPMLGKLGRFGRIAVVADQRWVRWATKLESALLPGISYETYLPSERDRALAWVRGSEGRPHAPAIRIIETDNPDVLGFEVDGRIGTADMDAVIAHFRTALASDGPVRMLGRIRKFSGADPADFFRLDYYRMKLDLLNRVERYALVGGPSWLGAWVSALDPLFKVAIRHFAAEEENLAWAWLEAKPVGERDLAA